MTLLFKFISIPFIIISPIIVIIIFIAAFFVELNNFMFPVLYAIVAIAIIAIAAIVSGINAAFANAFIASISAIYKFYCLCVDLLKRVFYPPGVVFPGLGSHPLGVELWGCCHE